MATGPRLTDELPPLAEAKLAAPRRRGGLVRRPRLQQALENGADDALTLVAAPPGYGKTTAVRAWYETSESAAWVTLDAGDNEPARFWTYVATAVDRIGNGLGHRALHRLRSPGMAIEVAVDEVMNSLADYGRPVTLVLDDLHTVTDPDCLASLDYAIEHLPATARLILITRADPAIELGPLRGRGALTEVRAAELAFTPSEAHELLVDRAGLELDERQIDVLMKRTEGWPAAIYLAALWLRTVEDRDRAVLEFGGDHRYVAEYLSHEVLAALDADHRAFLLRAAVLGNFTAELCDAVLDRSDSAAVLAEFEESNLFVLGLERREWFRVHALFAEFASARLALIEPGEPQAIHRRAATWLRARGLDVEAIEHAAAAGDHEVVAELLSTGHLALIRNGRSATIAIIVGAELVGNPHTGPIAGNAAQTAGDWTAWLGVVIFGVAIYIQNSAPRRSLPWLLIVLLSAWGGQLLGKLLIDATLSGFVGAAVMVPVAHLVGRARTAPPPHVMFLPAFWLLVPGTIGLIGFTEIVGDNPQLGTQNLVATLAAIPSVALGILVGVMTVRGAKAVSARRALK